MKKTICLLAAMGTMAQTFGGGFGGIHPGARAYAGQA